MRGVVQCGKRAVGTRENDIEYWLYNDSKKITIREADGTEKVIDISTIKKLWEYLENNRKEKLNNKAEKNE